MSHVCKSNHSGSVQSLFGNAHGDGDRKSFSTIKNTYPGITVQKLECVGHAQKRVGCRLRNLKKQEKDISGKADQ